MRSLLPSPTATLTSLATRAFKPFVEMVAAGGLSKMLNAMLADKSIYRSLGALGPGYEHPETATDEDIEMTCGRTLLSEQRTKYLERFVLAFDHKHTLAIEPQLRRLKAPTLIVWGTDDVYFPVKWAHWLAEAIPGAKPPVELPGANILPRGASRGLQSVATRALGRVTRDAGDPTPHKSKIPPARHCI